MGYLVVRGESIKRIHLSEISVLIIENTAVSLTAYLVSELVKNKIKLLFCDEKRSPLAEVSELYGGHDSSDMVRKQIEIPQERKDIAWQSIIMSKISNQFAVLHNFDCPNQELLLQYINEVLPGDVTNREGHAAKVYFNSLFGKSFYRASECALNAALNYGYSVLLSAVSREIAGYGFLTQLGIFHDNCDNKYNLSCDLMEPFRPVVDYLVKSNIVEVFEKEQKQKILQLLQFKIQINDRQETVQNAISIFVHSVLDYLLDPSVYIKVPRIDFTKNVV